MGCRQTLKLKEWLAVKDNVNRVREEQQVWVQKYEQILSVARAKIDADRLKQAAKNRHNYRVTVYVVLPDNEDGESSSCPDTKTGMGVSRQNMSTLGA